MRDTKQQKAIAFKVTDELYEKICDEAKREDISVSGLIKRALEEMFNPSEPEIKEVEKEVEKIVYVTKEGEVRSERCVDLYERVYAEFMKKKMPETSLNDYVNNWIWESMERTRLYYEKKYSATPQSQNINSASPVNTTTQKQGNTVIGESKYNLFEDFQKRKRDDCFTPEDWKELKEEIQTNTILTPKQKATLINYN